MKNKKVLGSVFILVAGVLWGHTCFFVNSLSSFNISKPGVGMLRLCIAFLLMLVYMLIFHRDKMKMPLKAFVYSLLGGLIGMVSCTVVYFYTIEITGPSIAAVLMYTAPSFTIIISLFIFKEKITIKKFICLVLAFLGSAMVSGLFSNAAGNVRALGIILGIVVGFTYALYGIFSSLAMKNGAEPEGVTMYAFTASSLSILAYTSITNELVPTVEIMLHNKEVLILAIGQATFDCIIPYILFTTGVKYTGASNASIMSTSELVVAAMIGAVKYGDKPGVIGYIGIVVVIASIVILNVERKKKKMQTE